MQPDVGTRFFLSRYRYFFCRFNAVAIRAFPAIVNNIESLLAPAELLIRKYYGVDWQVGGNLNSSPTPYLRHCQMSNGQLKPYAGAGVLAIPHSPFRRRQFAMFFYSAFIKSFE